MNIKELILELQKFPEDLHVLIDGYEGDFDDFKIYTAEVVRHPREEYYGDYQLVEDYNYSEPLPVENALVLRRHKPVCANE